MFLYVTSFSFMWIALAINIVSYHQIVRLQNHMGLCVSTTTTRRIIDEIRKGFDKDILDVKQIIEVGYDSFLRSFIPAQQPTYLFIFSQKSCKKKQ